MASISQIGTILAALIALAPGISHACDQCALNPALTPVLHPSRSNTELLRSVPTPATSPGVIQPQAALSVPAYSSLPSASAKIYLNFSGINFSGTWGNTGKSPGNVPAYSTDSDKSNFSSTELTNIYQIWSRVAEAYSPFNIDVTTVNPGGPSAYNSVEIVIGGSNAWYSSSAGGVAYIASFTYADSSNSYGYGWVFPDNLGSPKTVADAAIHEAGHTLGLYHQASFNGSGNLTAGYRSAENDPVSAPNMGVAYYRERGVWSNGLADNGGTSFTQLDLSQIASTSANPYNHPALGGGGYYNDFGYRADDHANSISQATSLIFAGNTATASGVIEQITDVDYFSFYLIAGSTISISLDNAMYGAMLDARMMIYSASGDSTSLIADVDPTLTTTGPSYGLDAYWNGTLSPGLYYVAAASHGAYSDIGQYTLTVAFSTLAIPEPRVAAGMIVLAALPLRRRK